MRRVVANSIAGFLDRFYPTAKALYMWRMRRDFEAATEGPILVLQMGKVGSTSVQAGLEALRLPRRIYHTHFLSPDRTRETETARRSYFRTAKHNDLLRPWLNEFLLRQYRQRASTKRWKIVTLTREPVGRNLSAFFENLDVEALDESGRYRIRSDYYGIEPTIVGLDATEVIESLFFARARHDSPIRFFDREIRDILGIDVLDAGFPKEKGYRIYQGERADLLVLKLEKLADCAKPAFEEFLGIPDFKLVNKNVGAAKVYAPLYESLKKNIEIPIEYADRLYDSPYMRTFYTEGEIRSARDRWRIRNGESPKLAMSGGCEAC